MGPSHVPSDHHPLQGQNIYNDQAFDNLYSHVDQFAAAPSWDQFNQNHPGLLPQSSTPQSWHQNLPQQSYNPLNQPYGSANQPYQTASPYQYAQFGNTGNHSHSHPHNPSHNHNHGPVNTYAHASTVDPSLGMDPIAMRQQQQSPYQIMRNSTPQGQPTVTPQALQQQNGPSQAPQQQSGAPQALQQQQNGSAQPLQHQNGAPQALQQRNGAPQSLQPQNGAPQPVPRTTASPFQIPKTTSEMFAQRAVSAPVVIQPPASPNYEVPKGKVTGGFYVIDQAALAKATKSNALNKFVNFGTETIHLASNRTALPVYNARQSIKELKKAGIANKKILDKLAKKPSSTKSKSKFASPSKAAIGGVDAIKRGVSDSESYTESSDESDYTSDEEDEPSPLPASRPDEPHAAVRYDVIKASWHPRRPQPDSSKIKASLLDLWEVLNTIQKRWRADSKAVTEAEEQKKTGELPVLKSRVTSQRDLLQTALKAALEYSHPDVLYHLGQVRPFSYLCYQFLANRFKVHDYDGDLSSVIYQVLVRGVGMLTNELLEETKLIKALNSMKKNANEANKAMIQKIIDGAAASSKKQKVASPPLPEGADAKGVKRPVTQTPARGPAEGASVKKVKALDTAAGIPKKVPAPVTAIKTSTATNPTLQKRPGDKPSGMPVKVKANPSTNKPSSSFFSSLNATNKKPTAASAAAASTKPNPQKPAAQAAKDKKPAPAAAKPAFSFAETMAQLLKPKEETTTPSKPEKQLPPETPEEKAKRLRKESRRHLRVTFRPDTSLVSIRYFHHDPEEEQGHDENFVRDAGDIGGEGRMFKQHRDMDEDDDDDEPELDYRGWNEPTLVNFEVVPADERERNYEPFGGGVKKPISPEKEANEQRELVTLMEFYTRPSDIPPSPREPADDALASNVVPIREFGMPPQKILDRAPAPLPALPDISGLESIVRQLAGSNAPQPSISQNTYMPPQMSPPPAAAATAPPPAFDIAAILSQIGSQQQAHAPLSVPPALAQIPALANIPAPPLPPGTTDLSGFLSAFSGSANTSGFPPLPAGLAQFAQTFQQQQGQAGLDYQQQQQQNHLNQHANGSMKRQRDDGNNHNADRGHGSFKKQKGVKHTGDRPAYKVIPCRFFKAGNCTKGDDCTFIHDRN